MGVPLSIRSFQRKPLSLALKALYVLVPYYLSYCLLPMTTPSPLYFSLATLECFLLLVQSVSPSTLLMTLFPLPGRTFCPPLSLKSLSTELKKREAGSQEGLTHKNHPSCKGLGEVSSVKCNPRNEIGRFAILFICSQGLISTIESSVC